MKVTSLKYQKKNPERVNIFMDDKYRFSLHVNNLIKYEIHVGVELSDERIEELMILDLEQRMYQRSSEYIMRAPRTSYQMRQYVRRVLYEKKGDWYPSDATVDSDLMAGMVVSRLEKNGLIDDKEFAIAFAQSRIRNKPRSKYQLKGELMERGVDKQLADDVVETLIDDEEELAIRLLQKKYHSDTIKKDEQKKIRFLQGKGFNWDVISKLIEDDI